VPHILANPQATRRAVTRRFDAPLPVRLWHLASFDAPTVAVVWMLGLAWSAKISLPTWNPVLLALVAWAVYIADRLLDARASLASFNHHRLRLRHRFHWRHRRFFVPAAVAAALGAAWIVFGLMPTAARERNGVLATAALAYFTGVHSRLKRQPADLKPLPTSPALLDPAHLWRPAAILSKELLVGLLFTAACALPVIGRTISVPGRAHWTLFASAVFLAALAWLNCHAIERWESREKASRGSGVFAPAILLALAGLLLAAVFSAAHPRASALIEAGAVSALLLALLHRLRSHLTPLALRAAADLVLLTPGFLLFS
jgi:hypothetical protein